MVLGSLYPPPFMQKTAPEYKLGVALGCVRACVCAWVHACVMSLMASVQETQVASMRRQ